MNNSVEFQQTEQNIDTNDVSSCNEPNLTTVSSVATTTPSTDCQNNRPTDKSTEGQSNENTDGDEKIDVRFGDDESDDESDDKPEINEKSSKSKGSKKSEKGEKKDLSKYTLVDPDNL